MPKSEKGHNLNVYETSPKVNQAICTMIPDHLQNFMNLALGVLEIYCLQDFPTPKYPNLKR